MRLCAFLIRFRLPHRPHRRPRVARPPGRAPPSCSPSLGEPDVSSPDLYNRRFFLFSGKGGVGKTTLAAAFALSCARQGERTLLMELNVKGKISTLFGAGEVDHEIREVDDNLFAVNVTPAAAMREYALMILKIKLVYRAVFENRIVSSFLKVIPGLNELVMLGKAYYHVNETDEAGRPKWDKIIVDAPATGHGIFFLKIPSVITSLVKSGLMFEEAQRILDLLQDPERTAINLVTLAEDMPVNETLELARVVREEMGVPIGVVLANAVYRPLFDEAQVAHLNEAHAALQAAADAGDAQAQTHPAAGFLEAARFRNARVAMQQEYLDLLREQADAPMIEVPFYFHDRMSFATIDEIAAHLSRELPALANPAEDAADRSSSSAG
ncbi:ArsA family ATPase [Lujinxingia vulgaris]|uniref:ArsA family ATPase n=1 Tax=Lujinxingia vulgaris TaxID=2600176 RepID=A0A5C6XHV2_9DELT|nr:ArsA family ATPase [Lujinxingia vulgaris]